MSTNLERHRLERSKWEELGRSMPDLFLASSTQYYRRREIALIRRSLGSLRGKRVLKLDLWNEAINTRILEWMKSDGAEVFGVEISHSIVKRARENSSQPEGFSLVQSDIRHLPFASDAFDVVYTMGTIEHIDEYEHAVDEVFRVLKPSGKAIIGVPHRWNIFLRPLVVKVLDVLGKYPYSPEKSFSSRQLRRVLERSGFRVRGRMGLLAIPGVIRMADLFFYRRNIPLHRLTPILVWPFESLEVRWEWPGLLGYMIALLGEKATQRTVTPVRLGTP